MEPSNEPQAQSAQQRFYWERHAAKYDASLHILNRRIPRMLELVADSVRGASSVLEVAAGTGVVTLAIAGAAQQVVATDYASAMVDRLKQRVATAKLSNVRCESADIYALRFESAAFDAVVAANLLHLVPDLQQAVAALRHVLRPGGKLIVPTFCHDETLPSALLSRTLALTGFPSARRFTTSSLRQALETHGLRIQRFERLAGLIPIGYVEGMFE